MRGLFSVATALCQRGVAVTGPVMVGDGSFACCQVISYGLAGPA